MRASLSRRAFLRRSVLTSAGLSTPFLARSDGAADLRTLRQQGNSYYLSPEGDDTNPGTAQRPWRSISRANETLKAGDTAIFKPGRYSGTISPKRSGTAWAPITYRAASRWDARLQGANEELAIQLDGKEHISLAGFQVGPGYDLWLEAHNCKHLTVRDCHMTRSGDHWEPFLIANSEHVYLLDNDFIEWHVRGDALEIERCSYVLLEGNSFARCGHAPFGLNTVNYAVVRNNIFHNSWGRQGSFWTCGRILVENNIFTASRNSAYSADSPTKNLYIDSIFRFNRVYDNKHTPLNSPSYVPHQKWTPDIHEPFRLRNSKIYNNTFTDNLGPAWDFWGLSISDNVFANNIFYNNDRYGGHVQISMDADIAGDNRFLNNIVRGSEPGQGTILKGDRQMTTREAADESPLMGGHWKEFDANLDKEPDFANAPNRDYRLTNQSHGQNDGRILTRTTRAGSGQVVPVIDGSYFYDGFGIAGEKGDTISIGHPETQVRITKIELNYYQSDLLHIDRVVDWKKGDPVSLPWKGDGPSVGAYPDTGPSHRSVTLQITPACGHPGNPISLQADIARQDVDAITWKLGDGTVKHGRTVDHKYAEPGRYPVRVRVQFTDGSTDMDIHSVHIDTAKASDAPLFFGDFEDETIYDWGYLFDFTRHHNTEHERVEEGYEGGKCIRLHATADGSILGSSVQPGEWNIDDYPGIRFMYRIPPGTPVGICLQAFPNPNYGEMDGRVIVGGTSAMEAGPYPSTDSYRLRDDGEWHQASIDARTIREELPEVNHIYSYRFYTHRNAPEGSEFWFDNFGVYPNV